jgi:hypothetical protein
MARHPNDEGLAAISSSWRIRHMRLVEDGADGDLCRAVADVHVALEAVRIELMKLANANARVLPERSRDA